MIFFYNFILLKKADIKENLTLKKLSLVAITLLLFTLSACRSNITGQQRGAEERTFFEEHNAFETNLVELWNDQSDIPLPPKGVFELDYYDSKVGELAAYISSDPEDGEKHPLIIWIVGGWGYGISEIPWSYPDWEDDQTGSAFREAGVLMMYPSFRGANGNPGNFETLFGEIDDIAAAYEYAASLPYVDSERIYLGGHSTGGTRALLVSAYTDKFRAVFSFGPVDNVKYHNKTQFTFDTKNNDEYKMRSPIFWLEDIRRPTFVIEGEGGNAGNIRAIDKASKNDSLFCYIIDDADHFDVLAPLTRVIADKILEDTGTECNIVLTKDELQEAMQQPPVISYPITVPYTNEEAGFSMMIPAIWSIEEYNGEQYNQYAFYAEYYEDNFWNTLELHIDIEELETELQIEDVITLISSYGFAERGEIVEIAGKQAYIASATTTDDDGDVFDVKIVSFQKGTQNIQFWFYTPSEYTLLAESIISDVLDSIVI